MNSSGALQPQPREFLKGDLTYMGGNMDKALTSSVIALTGYMILIFYFSSLPGDIPPPGAEILDIPRTIMHVGEYAILGLLVNLVMIQRSSRISKSIVYSSVFSSLYGVTDEIHQFFVPTRCFDVYDICADTIGGMIGATFVVALFTLTKMQK